jgi:uncharacterized protein (TIGR03083 family)
MFDFDTAASVTERELRSLRDELDALNDEAWTLPVRCAGWTIADLAAHLVGAANGQANGLRSASPTGGPLAELVAPDTRDPAKLRGLLKESSEALGASIAFTPALAESIVPLPFGPVPAALALQIVPLEYGFHRNDLGAATGSDEPLPDDIAVALVGILPGLLPVLAGGSAVCAPGELPDERVAFRLTSPSSTVELTFDGQRWEPGEDGPTVCRIEGDDSAIALFAMGRIGADDPRLGVSGSSQARNFKRWFPGP